MDRGNKGRRPPLHTAVLARSIRAVEALLKTGLVHIDTLDEDQSTALIVAMMAKEVDIVEMLVGAGADCAIPDTVGRTPLHLAAEWGNPSVMRVLLRSGANTAATATGATTPLHVAVQSGQVGAMKQLVEAGANVNVHDVKGQTPLMQAIIRERQEMVYYLIEHKADVSAMTTRTPAIHTPDGGTMATPLLLAAQLGNTEMARAIINAGADCVMREQWGVLYTPLHVSATIVGIGVAKLLLAGGAIETAPDMCGRSPVDLIGQKMEALKRKGPKLIGPLSVSRVVGDCYRNLSEAHHKYMRCLMMRGPAYRARSWLWPVVADDPHDAQDDADSELELNVRVFRARRKDDLVSALWR